MAVFKFPINPTNGQVYKLDGKTWVYNEAKNVWSMPPSTNINSVLENITSSVIPVSNEDYDLGSFDRRWRDLYLSGNSIYLGNMVMKEEGGALRMYDSNNQIIPLVGASVAISDTPPSNPANGDMWWSNGDVDGGIYVYYVYDNIGQWVDISLLSIGGGVGSAVDLTDVQTNIIPNTSNTFDIGSLEKSFKRLYLGTAYLDEQRVNNILQGGAGGARVIDGGLPDTIYSENDPIYDGGGPDSLFD
jgi:hypothetical protein